MELEMATKMRVEFALAVSAVMVAAGCGPRDHGGGRAWREFMGDAANPSRIAVLGDAQITLHSSFDRKGGNDDYNYFLRSGSEPGWMVLADLQGPGCLRRFWMTGVENGHPLKIYFDGEKKPRLSGTVDELFGSAFPFVYPIAQHLNQCWWSYVPLTFRKSLRIEAKHPPTHPFWGPRRLFFQVNVEPLPDAAPQTMPAAINGADAESAQHVCSVWRDALSWPEPPATWETSVVLSAGATGLLWKSDGPATVTYWDLALEPVSTNWSQRNKEHLLKDAVLQVRYDSHTEPSVNVPVGDFFCNAWRKRSFGSLLIGSAPWGYQCRLPMPFRSNISFVVINGSDGDVRVQFTPHTTAGVVPNAGYLHAEWRKSGPDAGQPHVVADLQGRGKFVGCFLALTSLDRSWWILEGDDQYFVDGAQAPIWHGTGLEDYFNCGWYYRGASFTAVSGIMDRYPFRTAQYRFHVNDPVGFSSSFRVQFERGDRNVSHGIMRSVAYLYLTEPRGVSPVPADRAIRRAEENPLEQYSLMLQLFELERMNNFQSAVSLIEEWLERYPGNPDEGVLRLRVLEYRRLMGELVAAADYQPFLAGQFGPQAAEQARILEWFYAQPGRALIGANLNGAGRVYLDGNEILTASSPLDLAVVGVEPAAGAHVLAAAVAAERPIPWAQFGIRMAGGMAGTGPGTAASRKPGEGWRTQAGDDLPGWLRTVPMDCMVGPPHGEQYMGARANAFVLLQSKVYGIRVADWDAYKGGGYFRVPFTAPLTQMQDFGRIVTGLER
jgi:hypothetical protein